MKRLTEHILTHTGSLPRPPALLEALQQCDHGETNGAALPEQVREAVAGVVQLQAQAGVSVVNDGEASKIGYSTYVKERLDGKALIPGVLDSTTNYMEHPELIAQRLVRYAERVGRENVIAGSDCGFATFASLLTVDPAITWAKLGAMAEGAQLASARIW